MKKAILFLTIFVALSNLSYSQFTFSASPGLIFSGANFGYEIDDLVPYIGLQYASLSLSGKSTRQEWDYDTGAITTVNHSDEIGGSVFMPFIGAKYFVFKKSNLKAYLNGAFFLPIISGTDKHNGIDNEGFKKSIDGTSLWGIEFGFGTEFFFDENFSIGGEFGLRLGNIGTEYTESDIIYTPTGEVNGKRTEDYSYNLTSTYTKIYLNYYFGD